MNAPSRNAPSHGPHPGHPSRFQELMQEVMTAADHFGHRQHIHLTWLAMCRYGTAAAVDLVSDGIQRTARYAGAPQKYNATVSRAWIELVGCHAAEQGAGDFADFAEHHRVLLDKRLLARSYLAVRRGQIITRELAAFVHLRAEVGRLVRGQQIPGDQARTSGESRPARAPQP